MADGAPSEPFVRRAATLPTRLQPSSSLSRPPPASSSSDAQTETLFACPSCRIVSFPSTLSRPTTSSDRNGKPQKKLPWTDRRERVRAAGPLRLYRLKESVCFLHSGELLLSIMQRSQCWCVDGHSKFAAKISTEVYRIELPYDTDTDKAVVNQFREVLDEVLQFEKTACPFERDFGDDLPEDDFSPARSRLRGPVTQARKWVSDEGWRPEDVNPDDWRQRHLRGNSPAGSDDGSRTSVATDETGATSIYSPVKPVEDAAVPIKPLSADAYRSYKQPHRYNFERGDPFYTSNQRTSSSTQEALSAGPGPPTRVFLQGASRPVSVANRVNGFSAPPNEPVPVLRRSSQVIYRNSRATAPPAVAAQDDLVVPQIRAPTKQVKIEEPITPASSNAQSDDSGFADQVTEALEQHSLQAEASQQSSHMTTTGPSPKPSFVSFKPILETIEAEALVEEATQHEPLPEATAGEAIATRSRAPAIRESEDVEQASINEEQTADTARRPTEELAEEIHHVEEVVNAQIPSDLNSPPMPDTRSIQPAMSRHRSFHTLNAKQSISLMSKHAMRRQPSVSFGPGADSSGSTDLATQLISKTVALLRGPPAGLLAVMVQIAAKIARGAFGPEAAAFRYREGKKRRDGSKWMPGGWESENEDEWEEDGTRGSEDDEDDYGVPLGCDTPARQRRKEWGKSGDATGVEGSPTLNQRGVRAVDGDTISEAPDEGI